MIHLVEGEDYPGCGRRVKRWFRARLAVFLNQQTDAVARRVQDSPELWKAVRDTYVEDIERYLYWKPADACPGGHGYAEGEHQLDTATIIEDLPEIVDECAEDLGLTPAGTVKPLPRPAVPPPPVPPGDLDVDAALAALGATAAEPVEEPRAWKLLSHDASRRLDLAVYRIRRKIPVACRVCGTVFVRRQLATITCDACKVAGQRRCTTCEEVFNTTNPKAKRCPGCIEKNATQEVEKAARRARRQGGE